MNVAVRPALLTPDAFLTWVQEQEGRFELKDGAIRMMTGATRRHVSITLRLVAAMSRQLDPAIWFVAANDLAVRIGEDIRYPDVVVEPAGGDLNGLLSFSPALIVEVLSPSSLHIDMREKAEEYLTLASLQAYIVASQDEPRVWVWLRSDDGLFPKQPTPVAGADKLLEVPVLSLSLPLGEVYAGVTP